MPYHPNGRNSRRRLVRLKVVGHFAIAGSKRGINIYGGQQKHVKCLTAFDYCLRHSLDGAYEFVSEAITYTKPEKTTERRDNSEWVGQWLFVNGRFSRSMMKKGRASALFNPPKAGEDIGYESASGHYILEDKAITMYLDIVEHPQNIGYPDYLQYRLDGDTLILTRKWSPNRHTDSEGQSVIVLRRVKS
jgi:hypothetical protein